MSRLLAPYTPFVSEELHQSLVRPAQVVPVRLRSPHRVGRTLHRLQEVDPLPPAQVVQPVARIDRRVLLAPQADGTIAVGSARMLAVASIIVWATAITSGRFLAYTCTRLMVDFGRCP